MSDIPSIIDKATSEYLIATDWSLNLQLCDTLNNDPNGVRDAVKHIAKRMKEKKSRVALLALELLETIVKNCEVVHPYVGGKEFQADIIKLAQNKKIKDNVRERLLELVQYWADSFQKRHDLPLFVKTYQLLRNSGVSFPPRRKDEPPLVFKNAPPARSSSVTSTNKDGAAIREFGSLRESVNLCIEMLSYFNVEEEDPNSNELLKDLIQTCKDSLPNVRTAIESGNFPSEEAMMELLSLNDEITRMSGTFEELVIQRTQFLKRGPSPSPAKAVSPSPTPSSASDFLDFTSDSLQKPFEKMSVQSQAQPQQQSLLSLDEEFGFIPTKQAQPAVPPKLATSPPPANPFHNPFPVPPPVNPNHVAVATTTSHPPANTTKPVFDDFDEFDMLAKSRHSTSPSAPGPVFSPPTTTQTSTTYQQPFVTQQPYRPQQPVFTPLQPQAPFLAPLQSQQPILTPLQQQQQQPFLVPLQQQPILTPLQPQAPFLGPLPTQPNQATLYPNMSFQPTYYQPYYNPMQPNVGPTPPKH